MSSEGSGVLLLTIESGLPGSNTHVRLRMTPLEVSVKVKSVRESPVAEPGFIENSAADKASDNDTIDDLFVFELPQGP